MTECEKNKKNFLISAVAVMCMLLLSGCEQNPDNESNGKVEVTLGGYFTHETATERYEYDIQSEKLFEELYPNVDIMNSKWIFSPDTYLAKAEGNTLPTVYYVPMTEAYNIIEQGYATDITDEYAERGYYESTRDFILENISRDGSVYMVPTGI